MLEGVPRWEPNTRIRLIEAALELFEQRGYDDTSVKQIAERAGVTKTTFFRQFTDKRDVLSAGQEEHSVLLAETIAHTTATATPLQAVQTALTALARTFPLARRPFAARVEAVAASNDELRERAGLKYAGYVRAMRTALIDRGVPQTTAAVAADLGLLAFRTAFQRWTDSHDDSSLAELVGAALGEVHTASLSLDASGLHPSGGDAAVNVEGDVVHHPAWSEAR
jgi:AcrR family transcriptional regulator